MNDYGNFCYMSPQKTGTSFVDRFLNRCARIERLEYRKHGTLKQTRKGCYYFITIRKPEDIYSSLFRYGSGSEPKGMLYQRLKRIGKLEIYEDFNKFFEFLSDPAHAPILHPSYTSKISEQIGFASFRFMRLSITDPVNSMNNAIKSKRKLLELEQNFFTNLEIKNENLNSALQELACEKLPEYFNVNKVKRFLSNKSKKNVSRLPQVGEKLTLNKNNFKILIEKDQLLAKRYDHY